jgi:hypothetical protein
MSPAPQPKLRDSGSRLPIKELNEFMRIADEQAIAACDGLPSLPSTTPREPSLGLLGYAATAFTPLKEPVDPAAEKLKRLSALLAAVHNHQTYRRLNATDGFRRIMRSRSALAVRNERFGGPAGEIRLIREVAIFVGGYSPEFKPRRATREHKRKVRDAAKALHDLLMPGAQPGQWQDARDLRRLLLSLYAQLSDEIQAAQRGSRRERRSDKDAAQRVWLINFATGLLAYFGEAPPTIVQEVAGMLNFEPDDRTVGRYISRAKSEWRKHTAHALQQVSDR